MISESEARHSIMRAVPTTQTKAGSVKNLRLMRIMIEKWLSFLKKKLHLILEKQIVFISF